jgi:hypothetical protein
LLSRLLRLVGGQVIRVGFAWWAGAMVAGLPLLIGAAIVTHSQEAQACRDCPFPLRVASGRWLMPNKQLEVQIHEEPYNETSMRVFVILRDANSKDVLATGETIRSNFKNNFTLQLADHGGRLVRGQIRWINKADDVIQARFLCQGACTIQRYFDQ